MKISQYPNIVTLADSDLFILARGTGNKNINWSQLKALIRTVASAPLEPLILWYKVDEGAGGVLTDSSGNGNHGNIIGATWVSGHAGTDHALHFDGVNDWAKSDAAVTFGTDLITVCAWLNWDDYLTNNRNIWIMPDWTTDNNFTLYQSTNAPVYKISASMQGSVAAPDKYRTESFDAFSAAQWAHLAVVYDNTTASGRHKVYVNGVFQTLGLENNVKDKNGNFATGLVNLFYDGITYGKGSLQDFRIYAGELSLENVVYVMNHPE